MEAASHFAPSSPATARRHFLLVARALASTEFKLRYFGSVLGYLWTLLKPLMLFGVLYVLFTHIVRIGKGVDHYPVMLLTGIVLYVFFSEATTGALGSLVARENLLRKVSFPRAAIPVAVSMTAAANFALGLVVVIALALFNGVEVRATWLLFPLLVLALVGFAIAVSLLLSVLYVRFRDVSPIWEVVLQLTFWGTPIFYTIETVPHGLRHLIMASPFAVIVQQSRHWLIDPHTLSASAASGGWERLLIPLAIYLGVCLISVVTFRRLAPRAAEEL
jgi:ABC-2 type transport system permease protein